MTNQLFTGGYHSAFKGKGMSFSEVRSYQFGDDVRNIDWNVSARMGETFIKVFEEERELNVMFLIDVSPSTLFGSQPNKDQVTLLKQEIMTEIAAVLSFSANTNNDKVGGIFFTDTIEKFIPPQKGRNHVLLIIRELLDFQAKNKGTDLAQALRHLNNVMKKRSILFILSDFMNMGPDYSDALNLARKRHDVIGIHIFDDREAELPNIGLIRVRDAETGQPAWLDTASRQTRESYATWYRENLAKTRETFARSGADFISINTRSSYITSLLNLFSMRGKRM